MAASLCTGASAQITPFSFESHAVRVIDRDGSPWFVAADVCAALAVRNTSDALRRLDADEQALVSIEGISRGNDQVNLINESGLYSLILGSRKAEAKRFKKWVTSEVLPAIRKTGKYEAQPTPAPSHAERSAVAQAAAQGASAWVHQSVFSAVMAGGDWKHQRWLVSFITDSREAVPAWVDKLPGNDLAGMTPARLAREIAQPGSAKFSNAELAALAAACGKALAERLEHHTGREVAA